MKKSIGQVTIRPIGSAPGELGVMGDERVRLLREFYVTQQPPEGFEAVGFNPLHTIAWNDVNWDTAGECVTSTRVQR